MYRKGEVSTIIVGGVIALIAVATLITSTFQNERKTLNTQAEFDGTSCNDNIGDNLNPNGPTSFTINCWGNLNKRSTFVLFWCPNKSRGATYCGDPNDINSGDAQVLERGEGTVVPTTLNKSTDKTCGCVQWDVGVFNSSGQEGVAGGAIMCADAPCNTSPTVQPTILPTQPPQPTNTPVPQATNTPVPQPTNTPVPNQGGPTNTPVPQATNTPVPVATNTPVPNTSDGRCTYIGDPDCITLTPRPNTSDGRCTYIGDPDCVTLTPRPNTTDGRCTYIGDPDCITLTPSATPIKLPNGTSCTSGSTCQSGCCSSGLCNSANMCQSASCRPGQTKCPGTDRCVDDQAQCNPPTPTPNKTYLPIVQSNPLPPDAGTRFTTTNDIYMYICPDDINSLPTKEWYCFKK